MNIMAIVDRRHFSGTVFWSRIPFVLVGCSVHSNNFILLVQISTVSVHQYSLLPGLFPFFSFLFFSCVCVFCNSHPGP